MAAYNPLGGAVSLGEDYNTELEELHSLDNLDIRDPERVAATGTQEAEAGQDESLLPAGQGGFEKLDGNEGIEFRKKRRWFSSALSVIIIFAIVLFDVWLLLRPDSSGTRGPSTDKPSQSAVDDMDALVNKPLRRPNDDYVLDPHWDFGAPSQIRYYNWTIVDKDGNPDGVFKPMMTIDGQFPGPLIEVNEGDTIVVDVLNLATNATSIHWHGIFQNGTNFMDGTSGVTQCPIAPGYSFRYNFTLTGQAGTYFYHGHQGVQSLDGLVGPLVIHDRDAANNLPLRYESDRVVLLQDWYYDPGSGLLRDSLSPGNEAAPVPNAALINGLNQVDCSLHPGRRCVRDGTALPVLNLNPGANHRLRFANVGGFAWFQVSVDEHSSLPIVEVDGTTIEPAAESVIILSPGQRYSVILTANQATQNNYWLRARMIKACFGEPNMPEDGVDEAKAIVQYSAPSKLLGSQSDTSGLPTTNDTNINYIKTCKDMTSRSTYRPTPPQPAPEYADHSWYLRINLAIGDWRLQRGVINQSSFRPNLQEPTLHRFLDGFASSNFSFNGEGINTAAFAPSELVISNKGVETVDVILQNMDEGSHPFHLHGTQMWILGAGHGYFPGYKALGLKPQGMGLLDPNNSTVIDNPLKRDTATAEGFGWVLLRFVADNPGVWLFHCHMIWHSEAGMAMQFASRLEDMKSWALPEENRRLCGADREELYKGAPPSDDIFFGFHNDDR